MRLTTTVGAAATCFVCLLAALPRVQAQPPAPPGPTVRYEPTAGVPTFAVRPPVLRITPGTTVIYLPIFHEGAYFYFGDGHALQGDGEICGSGLETTMDVALQFDVIKGRTIDWPRFEDADHLMVAGSGRPLVDAFRIAQVEPIEWLVEDYGFDMLDAYQVVSQAGVTRVANVVDPNFTVVAKFPKKFLPAQVPIR